MYDLVSTQTSVQAIIKGYESGAAALISSHIAPGVIQESAAIVVESVLNFVANLSQVDVGGYACSVAAVDDGKTWISAVFCQVEFCRAADWQTPVDFNIILFVFVVWPSSASATALRATGTFTSRFPGPPPTVLHW
jgi:hypothetical protein